MTALNSLAVTEADLKVQIETAQAYLENARHQVELRSRATMGTHVRGSTTTDEVSITGIVKAISVDDPLPSDAELHTLRAIRRAMQMGFHLSEQYRQRSGAASFDSAHGLADAQKAELNEKMQTAAAIMVFVTARFILWDMRLLVENNSFVGNIPAEFDQMDISTPRSAVMTMMYFLGKHLEKEVNDSDERLVAAVYGFAQVAEETILNRVTGFKYTEPFTSVSYTLENDDFMVAGFEPVSTKRQAAEVKEVYPDDVIGNKTAVAAVESSMRKLFLYDPATQRNPINDFGGFESVQFFSGDPGNGKTLILSVARTLGRDFSEATGIPYQDIVVPNMVSKMQGESTDLAQSVIRQLLDPRSVNLGIGDEWEVVMPDHGGDHVSEGDKKVAIEWLKGLSGVSSQDRGNFLMLSASNYPENVDKAYMSRVKAKHYIVGAETEDDYVRFIILNLRKLFKKYPRIVNLKNVDWEMDIRAPQVPNSEDVFVSPDMSVADIYAETAKVYDHDDIRFFARFFFMMKLRQSTFSLRDCANIIDGAKAHVAGFEVPVDWIEQPATYVEQEFEVKTGLISELADAHVADSGVNFAEMLSRQAMYYAEEALRMGETRLQRAVDARAEDMLVYQLAENQLADKFKRR